MTVAWSQIIIVWIFESEKFDKLVRKTSIHKNDWGNGEQDEHCLADWCYSCQLPPKPPSFMNCLIVSMDFPMLLFEVSLLCGEGP